jgi:hypothetical protein
MVLVGPTIRMTNQHCRLSRWIPMGCADRGLWFDGLPQRPISDLCNPDRSRRVDRRFRGFLSQQNNPLRLAPRRRPQSSLIVVPRRGPAMGVLTSGELNYLVFRYLQESGARPPPFDPRFPSSDRLGRANFACLSVVGLGAIWRDETSSSSDYFVVDSRAALGNRDMVRWNFSTNRLPSLGQFVDGLGFGNCSGCGGNRMVAFRFLAGI